MTRKRTNENQNKNSVLDLLLVCDTILPLVVKMNVDEQGIHQLSNLNDIRHNSKVTESDHAVVELHLKLEFPTLKPTRKKFFNLKNIEEWIRFSSLTGNPTKLSACFDNDSLFMDQFKMWQHTLDSFIFQSFLKICTRNRKFSETECGKLVEVGDGRAAPRDFPRAKPEGNPKE